MITIKLDRKHYALSVEGHADDKIVCAGVSALAHTYALYVKLVPNTRSYVQEGEGFTYIEADPSGTGTVVLETAYSVVIEGLMALAKDYGDEIDLHFTEKGDTGSYKFEGAQDTIKSRTRTPNVQKEGML